MQHALFISRPAGLRHLTERHERLYFGAEFCQHMLPTRDELRRVRAEARERQLGFTLVTPMLTSSGFAAVAKLCEELGRDGEPYEVVVNDLGLLRWCAERAQENRPALCLGRLLTKLKRGPRILGAQGNLTQDAWRHFRTPGPDRSAFGAYLRRRGVVRIELCNVVQGLERGGEALPASLYHPWVYVSTGRYCQFCETSDPERALRALPRCQRECLPYRLRMEHPGMPVPLTVRGSTTFFENSALPERPELLGVDRLVELPEPPV